MKHLVHAILWRQDVARAGLAIGSDSGRVAISGAGTLAAAWSSIGAAGAAPDVPELLSYARVVQDLFQRATVLPLRYGHCLGGEQELCQLLIRNETALQEGLRRVEGCVEIGLRILTADVDLQDERREHQPSTAPAERPASVSGPGIAYLLKRRRRFQDSDGCRKAFECVTRRIQDAFAGLYRSAVAEPPGPRGSGSLCFLIRREHGELFRRAFRELQPSLPEKLLLSGPWPPYHFVAWKTSGWLP